MNKRTIIILVIVAAVAAFIYYNGKKNPPANVTVNANNHPVAPNFALADLDGKKLSLADYKGKVVLVDFWATWCSPCREEIPRFVEFQKQYGDQGFQIVGISMDDSVKPVRDFSKEFKLNYPVVMGDTATSDAYGGVLGLPINILVGRDGRIYAKYTGMTDLKALESEIKAQLAAKP